MKQKFLLFAAALFILISCAKDDPTPEEQGFSLPPETQTGANTFGVTINGKVYIPRDPTGFSTMPQGKGLRFLGDHIFYGPDIYNEIKIVDGASSTGFNMTIHIYNLQQNGSGDYILSQSNFQDNIDSIDANHIFFKIWDNNINNYAYYGSLQNQGQIIIKRYDFSSRIVSGTFNGKFVRYDNPNEFIQINDGRFDINWQTLPNILFP